MELCFHRFAVGFQSGRCTPNGGEMQDFFLCGIGPRKFAGQSAEAHNEYPISQSKYFGQIAENDEDRDSFSTD